MNTLSNNQLIDSHFLATTIHEIRTPIQTILGTIELFQETPMNAEQLEYVRQLQFSAEVLLTLSNDILDISKIASGQFTIEKIPFEIVPITEQIFDLVCIEAYNKNLELITDLDYSMPCTILGDPTRIQQVLLNLIKNAVKFTKQGYIRLAVHTRMNNSLLLFEIQDSGIGISDEKKQKIFADYVQANASTSRQFGGTGLGLTICRNLVHLMGGKIGVKDNPHGGSVFWFTIPLETRENTKVETLKEKHEKTIPADIKILLVDDSTYALKSLQKKLFILGSRSVDISTSGPQAITKIEASIKNKTPYDIVMIDMKMPKMDGWRLASTLENKKLINNTKLYLIIPEGQLGSEAKMKKLGWFNGYIYKPIKINTLSDLLHIHLNTPMDLENITDTAECISKKDNRLQELPYDHNLKMLIAEDHPINRKLLATFLFQLHAIVFTASNGEEAVDDILRHPDIDLIFMDVEMPVKNGIEATKALRNSGYKGIIIACTANSDEHYFNEYLQNGMNDVLVKPFKRNQVYSILKKWQHTFETSKIISSPQEASNPKIDINSVCSSSFWDILDMLDTTQNDIQLTTQLIEQYIEQFKQLQKDAEDAVKYGDTKQLQLVAHTIKGSSATLSINSIANSAKLCEDSARNGDLKTAIKHLKIINSTYSQFYIIAQQKLKDWK
ncbi:MAG: hypothetical protein BKP49_03120 [Treponema sp. CETP13]|nr:MAG: hypothetical protein BKP49_03120 [Treponema sp. CETP13]